MARKPEPVKKPSRVTVPPRAHPLAKLVFAQMQKQGVTYEELSYRSGVLPHTFKAWRTDNTPGLSTMEACLGALGWALVPVPRIDLAPESVRAACRSAAAEWEGEDRVLAEILATVCTKPILVQTDGPVVATITPRRRRRQEHPDQARLIDVVEEAA